MAITRIGDLLLGAGVITPKELNLALKDKDQGEKLGKAVIRLGFASEGQILDALEKQTGYSRINLMQYPVSEEAVNTLSESFSKKYNVICISITSREATIAMSDPLDYFVSEDVRLLTGLNVKIVLATEDEITTLLTKFYDFNKTLEALGLSNGETEKIQTKEVVLEQDEESPLISLVDQLLQSAVRQKVSDIHIDPRINKIEIRFRLDGSMYTEKELPKALMTQITSRIKVMANIDITETRTPQDGRIKSIIDDKPIDFRVSTLPTIHGEKIVMRILDMSNNQQGLDALGIEPNIVKQLKAGIAKPNGIFLVSGPTGSGKTSTLYSCLHELNTPDVNIITVENPVELQFDGVNQVPVDEEVGMTFAGALRAILRQDPNIIMLGEIRDGETASIAFKAAMTGHLVLSTIHTNDSLKTLARLVDLGLKEYMITSAVNIVVAQRLVRRICKECCVIEPPTIAEQEFFKEQGVPVPKTVVHPVGCKSCSENGYKGRAGLFEVLVFDEGLIEQITAGKNELELKTYLRKQGMKFLIDVGLDKVKEHVTSLSEVLKVTVD